MDEISAFGRQSVVARVGGELVGDGPGPVVEPLPTASGGFTPAGEKYEVEATIGQGGMGE